MGEQASYNVGDKVMYHPTAYGNTTTGEIVDIIKQTQRAGTRGLQVRGSEEEPRYLIRNDNTGKETAYTAKRLMEKV